jgi:hypothetical protein
MNDALSILGRMAQAQEKAQENLGCYLPGNFRGGGQRGRNHGGRGRPRTPFNNRQGQDHSKEIVNCKQQASRAAAQESKRRKKSSKDSAWDREGASDSEYPESAYQARPKELRLGRRVEITAEEEDEWDSPSLYRRTAGELDARCHKSDGRYPRYKTGLTSSTRQATRTLNRTPDACRI